MAGKKSEDYIDETAWIDAALELLSGCNIDEISIEPLAKRLGVTKGSFYWHFKDRAALFDAVLRTWKQRATLAIIERMEASPSTPAQRIKQLIDGGYPAAKGKAGAQAEMAIRAWARRDENAAAAVAEVDQQRLAYVQALYKRIGLDDADAAARAYLMYAYNFAESAMNTIENTKDAKARRQLVQDVLLPAADADEATPKRKIS
jgi:AcrR family transcriptional regulator